MFRWARAESIRAREQRSQPKAGYMCATDTSPSHSLTPLQTRGGPYMWSPVPDPCGRPFRTLVVARSGPLWSPVPESRKLQERDGTSPSPTSLAGGVHEFDTRPNPFPARPRPGFGALQSDRAAIAWTSIARPSCAKPLTRIAVPTGPGAGRCRMRTRVMSSQYSRSPWRPESR